MTTFPNKLTATALALVGALAIASFAQANAQSADDGKAGGMKRSDTNGDGKISLEEMSQRRGKRFDKLDANGDGKLSEDELRAKIKKNPEKRSKRMVKRMDKDGDGMISREEFDAQTGKIFSRIDANSDGFVDEVEMQTFRKKRRDKKNKPTDGNSN